MNLKQKLIFAVTGFLTGNIFLASLLFGYPYFNDFIASKNNEITFAEAMRRLEAGRIREIKIKGDKVYFVDDFKGAQSSNLTEGQIVALIKKVPNDGLKFTVEPYSTRKEAPADDAPDPLVYLFQILFWLFLLSPPIIVILLLVIISKMNKSSEKLK